MEDLIGEETFPCPAFAEFVRDAFDQYTWVRRDPFALSGREALTLGWEEFKHTVKHETRFVFALIKEPPDPYPDPGAPVRKGAAFLQEVGRLIREFGFVRALEPDPPLYRVRVCEPENRLAKAKDIGAPEPHDASQSRMSPAGIPMVYCALDRETAVSETLDCERQADKVVWTGMFRVRAPTPARRGNLRTNPMRYLRGARLRSRLLRRPQRRPKGTRSPRDRPADRGDSGRLRASPLHAQPVRLRRARARARSRRGWSGLKA
jgi:hypothetical protein